QSFAEACGMPLRAAGWPPDIFATENRNRQVADWRRSSLAAQPALLAAYFQSREIPKLKFSGPRQLLEQPCPWRARRSCAARNLIHARPYCYHRSRLLPRNWVHPVRSLVWVNSPGKIRLLQDGWYPSISQEPNP